MVSGSETQEVLQMNGDAFGSWNGRVEKGGEEEEKEKEEQKEEEEEEQRCETSVGLIFEMIRIR